MISVLVIEQYHAFEYAPRLLQEVTVYNGDGMEQFYWEVSANELSKK
jgi:hypothetical protein